MDAHAAVVATAAARVQHFHRSQEPFRIYHGSTNSTRRSQRRLDNTVDTSKLNHVIRVDSAAKTAVVEPNVPMDALVAATLKSDLVPPVVMEFPGITVGGGFSGSSGESSSFRYGVFEMTINWIEIILPSGDITRASKVEKPDLFWGAASALGTLGVVTLLEIQLIDAKPYVELTYRISPSMADAVVKIQEETANESNDYVDSIIFSPDSVMTCTGRLVDALPQSSKPQRFTRRRDPWFWIHAREVHKRLGKTGSSCTDYIPLTDYLFRYDRGSFWTGQFAFEYFKMPFNRVTRFLLDPLMHTRVVYRAVHKSGLADFHIAQDIPVPYDKAEEFRAWIHENLGFYPIWLCPLRMSRDSPDSQHGLHSRFGAPDAPPLINFGVWGSASYNRRDTVRINRAMEEKARELGGMKCLYAHTYYTEEEFWANYDKSSYDALREKYGATYLPSVFDKVKIDVDAEEADFNRSRGARVRARFWSIWPMRGLRGVYKALIGGDYLLQRKGDSSTGKTEER